MEKGGREETMILFHTDLDNTMIYSYKHDIGSRKRSVELYQGREISFITEKTYDLLKQVKEHMLIVPTSTRTVGQYGRIDLGIGSFPYALVCNGGILLVHGEIDRAWYRGSLDLVSPASAEMHRALSLLEEDARRMFELRFIEKLFVFTKCREPEQVVRDLGMKLDPALVDVFHNGIKVYVVPKSLSKGAAVERLKQKLMPQYVIAAGDSEFDISMVEIADKGLVPHGFRERFGADGNLCEMDGNRIFSEALLEECLRTAGQNHSI